MKLAVGGGVLAVGVAILCFAPGAAVARDRTFVIGPSTMMEAHIRGSKGFRVSLSASKRSVDLSASGHRASVQYTVPGHVSAKRIKARFGHLGLVSLRFRASQKPHLISKPEENCEGGGRIIEPGVFVGRVEFEGEQGYTSVHAHRVRGKITRNKKAVCHYEDKGHHQPALGITALNARTKGGRIEFSAFKFESEKHPAFDGTDFSAAVFETGPRGLAIFRVVEESGKPEDFDITRAHGRVVSATLNPPAPFNGSVTYQGVPASPSEAWTGSLSVDFPGLGEVGLTGPSFCVETKTLAGCEGEESSWVAVNARKG